MSMTMSVFFTLWIQGMCLSPMPSIRWPPKPFSRMVGHWRASPTASFRWGYCSFSRSPADMVPAEPEVKAAAANRSPGRLTASNTSARARPVTL